MSDTIANRNDDQYSSTMMSTLKVETLPVDTSIFPVIWRHIDDMGQARHDKGSVCAHPEVCLRDTYAEGGAPSTLAE